MAIQLHHWQGVVDLQVLAIREGAGGHDQTVHLTLHQVVYGHHLLTGVFVATGDEQLQARLPAEGFQLAGNGGKAIVGQLRHYQANGMTASGA